MILNCFLRTARGRDLTIWLTCYRSGGADGDSLESLLLARSASVELTIGTSSESPESWIL